MRLGLSTYSYTWAVGVPGQMPEHPMTAFALVEEAVRLGVPCVQIADNLPLHLFSDAELRRLSDFAWSKGISIEIGARGLQPENVVRYAEITALLGSPILRVVIDAAGFEPSVGHAIHIIREILPVLKKNNIKLAIENHDRLTSAEFVDIVTGTDPEWVGICLDSVNSMGAGEGMREVVNRLAPHTINLHLKDFAVKRVWHKMGFVIEGVPAGEGMLNIDWLRKEVEHYGKCQSAILELWTPPGENLNATIAREKEWVEKSVSYLKTIF